MPTSPVLFDRDSDAALALLCAKMTHTTTLEWYTAEDTAGETVVGEEFVVQALKDADLIKPHPQYPRWGGLTLTPEGREAAESATAEMLCSPVDSGEDRAAAALWFWLILRGGTQASYGSYDRWGRRGEIGHVLICGLDLRASGGVRDDRWTEWRGTFSDDRNVAGVGGYATCRCGTVSGLNVVHEVESITDLLRQALGLGA